MNLRRFIVLALREAPRGLWLLAGGLVLGILNLLLQDELWPHTPLIEKYSVTLLIGCGLVLPWVAARWSWRITRALHSGIWWFAWYLASALFYALAAGTSVVGFVGFIALLMLL
jgi:hypothetical protein